MTNKADNPPGLIPLMTLAKRLNFKYPSISVTGRRLAHIARENNIEIYSDLPRGGRPPNAVTPVGAVMVEEALTMRLPIYNRDKANNIIARLKAKRLSQSEIGRRIGIDKSAWSKIVRGIRPMTRGTLERLKSLEISLEEWK